MCHTSRLHAAAHRRRGGGWGQCPLLCQGGGWGRRPLAGEEDGPAIAAMLGRGVAVPPNVAPGREMGTSTPELGREMEPPSVIISD
jgi:hypothetical protein